MCFFWICFWREKWEMYQNIERDTYFNTFTPNDKCKDEARSWKKNLIIQAEDLLCCDYIHGSTIVFIFVFFFEVFSCKSDM